MLTFHPPGHGIHPTYIPGYRTGIQSVQQVTRGHFGPPNVVVFLDLQVPSEKVFAVRLKGPNYLLRFLEV